MGSERVWQLKHTQPPHTCARVCTRTGAVWPCTHGWVYRPQGAGVTRAAGKTAGENASGVKKSYARGADERALFTGKNGRLRATSCECKGFYARMSSGMTGNLSRPVKKGREHDRPAMSTRDFVIAALTLRRDGARPDGLATARASPKSRRITFEIN